MAKKRIFHKENLSVHSLQIKGTWNKEEEAQRNKVDTMPALGPKANSQGQIVKQPALIWICKMHMVQTERMVRENKSIHKMTKAALHMFIQ